MNAHASQPPEQLTARRREILDAALRILETEGPAAVTMRRLAAELGIQAPSLYKHISDKGVIDGLLQQHAMARFGEAVRAAGPGARAVAAAYRTWALANRHLYELATRRPLRRDIVEEAEAFAAAPLVEAVGGDPDKALALLGLAHGLVDLELNDHFPAGTDVQAAWDAAVDALAAAPRSAAPSPRRSATPTTPSGGVDGGSTDVGLRYDGPPLTAPEEAQVRQYIDFIRTHRQAQPGKVQPTGRPPDPAPKKQ
jgi:AcrR family transcriptional regulator